MKTLEHLKKYGSTLVAMGGLLAIGCSGSDDAAGIDAAASSAAIINGNSDLSGFPNERVRTVRVKGPLGSCSGTVMRPNVVLTARHCVNTTKTIAGTLQPPSKITVNGVRASAFQTADDLVDAVLILFKGIVVNQWEDFTAFDPYPLSRYTGGVGMLITGWGEDENGDSGVLRVGILNANAINRDYDSNGGPGFGLRASNTSSGMAVAHGDSGGPMWGIGPYPRPVVGAASVGENVAFGDSYFAQGVDFRFAFRNAIYDWIDPGVSVAFDSAADLTDNFRPLQATTGTAPNWVVSGGALVQTTNAPQAFQVQNGTFENAVVQMYVQSSDDDTVGIALRYVDKDNHYRCEANRAGRVVRIIERRNGTEVELASTPWNDTFNGVMTAAVTEKLLDCSFGSTRVLANSRTFAIGKVAIYNHRNQGAKILWYGSAQIEPRRDDW